MKTLKTRYYHIVGKDKAANTGIASIDDNYVKADVYYSEGGYGILTGQMQTRGYFISVSTVGRGSDEHGTWECINVFGNKGAKRLITEVSRQSKKKAAEAIAYFDEHIDEFIRKVYQDMKLEYESEKLST